MLLLLLKKQRPRWNLVQTTCLPVETESVLCKRGGVMVTWTVKMDLMKKAVVCNTELDVGPIPKSNPIQFMDESNPCPTLM